MTEVRDTYKFGASVYLDKHNDFVKYPSFDNDI